MIEVRRYKQSEQGTLGILFIDGGFRCHTLEPPPKEFAPLNPAKIYKPSKGHIPTGTYPLDLRRAGGMHARYAKRFSEHRGMIWLRGVPSFRFIYIHYGNTIRDTKECILVACGSQSVDGIDSITYSVKAYRPLYEEIVCAIEATNDVRIKITEV